MAAVVMLAGCGCADAVVNKYISSYGITNYEEYDRINIFVDNSDLMPCWVNYTCYGDCYQLQPNWPSSSYCNHRTYVFEIYMGGAWNEQKSGGTMLTPHTSACGYGSWGSYAGNVVFRSTSNYLQGFPWTVDCTQCAGYHTKFTVSVSAYESECSLSGVTGCVNTIYLFWDHDDDGTYDIVEQMMVNNSGMGLYPYSFGDLKCGEKYAVNYDGNGTFYFVASGETTNSYDACPYHLWVYGYTCGVDTVTLRDDNQQIVAWTSQNPGYDNYELPISDGNTYTISFLDQGIILKANQTFTCTGSDVHIDYDRCEYIYPPSPYVPPYIIYLWTGYDYNIVVFKDRHGNLIENSQLAIYDKTDSQYLQRWTATKDGYALLGTRFDTDHDVLLTLRTFDGVFTLDTTYPANGSALVGEENITTTNWTIPIKYNLKVYPVDEYAVPLFDVFCGLAEYTPLAPQSFWGMDLGRVGYVPVMNCSGFAMCDLIVEKGGYVPYNETALNWSSKSALVKDYRHEAVLVKE